MVELPLDPLIQVTGSDTPNQGRSKINTNINILREAVNSIDVPVLTAANVTFSSSPFFQAENVDAALNELYQSVEDLTAADIAVANNVYFLDENVEDALGQLYERIEVVYGLIPDMLATNVEVTNTAYFPAANVEEALEQLYEAVQAVEAGIFEETPYFVDDNRTAAQIVQSAVMDSPGSIAIGHRSAIAESSDSHVIGVDNIILRSDRSGIFSGDTNIIMDKVDIDQPELDLLQDTTGVRNIHREVLPDNVITADAVANNFYISFNNPDEQYVEAIYLRVHVNTGDTGTYGPGPTGSEYAYRITTDASPENRRTYATVSRMDYTGLEGFVYPEPDEDASITYVRFDIKSSDPTIVLEIEQALSMGGTLSSNFNFSGASVASPTVPAVSIDGNLSVGYIRTQIKGTSTVVQNYALGFGLLYASVDGENATNNAIISSENSKITHSRSSSVATSRDALIKASLHSYIKASDESDISNSFYASLDKSHNTYIDGGFHSTIENSEYSFIENSSFSKVLGGLFGFIDSSHSSTIFDSGMYVAPSFITSSAQGVLLNGSGNWLSGVTRSMVLNGLENWQSESVDSAIVTGQSNWAIAVSSSVLSGTSNSINGAGSSAVIAGYGNAIGNFDSSENLNEFNNSAILSGRNNDLYAFNSAILAGLENEIRQSRNSVLFGDTVAVNDSNLSFVSASSDSTITFSEHSSINASELSYIRYSEHSSISASLSSVHNSGGSELTPVYFGFIAGSISALTTNSSSAAIIGSSESSITNVENSGVYSSTNSSINATTLVPGGFTNNVVLGSYASDIMDSDAAAMVSDYLGEITDSINSVSIGNDSGVITDGINVSAMSNAEPVLANSQYSTMIAAATSGMSYAVNSAIIGGTDNTLDGTVGTSINNSVILGGSNNVVYFNSSAILGSTGSSTYNVGSTVLSGKNAIATREYEIVLGGLGTVDTPILNKVSAPSDTRYLGHTSVMTGSVSTPNATPAKVVFGSSGLDGGILLFNRSSVMFSIHISAANFDESEDQAAAFQITGSLDIRNNVARFLGQPVINVLHRDVANWEVDVSLDQLVGSPGGQLPVYKLGVNVVGAAGSTVVWAARVELTQVNF